MVNLSDFATIVSKLDKNRKENGLPPQRKASRNAHAAAVPVSGKEALINVLESREKYRGAVSLVSCIFCGVGYLPGLKMLGPTHPKLTFLASLYN